jgi:hypothetical protein
MSHMMTGALIVGFLAVTCFPIWPQFLKVHPRASCLRGGARVFAVGVHALCVCVCVFVECRWSVMHSVVRHGIARGARSTPSPRRGADRIERFESNRARAQRSPRRLTARARTLARCGRRRSDLLRASRSSVDDDDD